MFECQAQSKEVVNIMLYGTLSEWGTANAQDFAKAIQQAEKSGYRVASLRINSPGGSVFEGLAMMAQMKASTLTFHAYIDGMAASMASVVAVSADRVLMAKGGRMMIHQGSGGVYGSASQIKTYSALLQSLNETLAEVYAEKTGKQKDWVLAHWMGEGQDMWFTDHDAKKAGLVDAISGSVAPVREESTAASYMEIAAHYEHELNKNEKDKKMRALLIKQLGLTAEATDEAIATALEAALKPQANPDFQKEDNDALAVLMALGKSAGLITDKNKTLVRQMAEKVGAQATIELLKASAPDKPADDKSGAEGLRASDILEALKGHAPSGKPPKQLEDYTPEELDALESKDSKAFEALFKASALGKVDNPTEN